MKLKYYMRGVGTGILFSLFVFLVIIIPNVRLEERMANLNPDDVSQDQSGDGDNNLSSILGTENTGTPTLSPTLTPEPTLTSTPDTVLTLTVTPTPDQELTPTTESADVPTLTPTLSPTPVPTLTPTPSPTPVPTSTPTPSPTPVPTSTPTPSPTPMPTRTPTKTPTATPTPVLTLTPTSTPTPPPVAEVDERTGKVRFTVTRGMTSEQFSSYMEKLGVVDDWKKLNNYIVRNGYALRIQIGTFTFEKGMSYSEVTRIVTGR